MKNYKFLVPLFLVILFAGSFYMLYDTKATELERYNTYLKSARHFRKIDIQVDAEENYKNALNLKPSLDLYIEIGEYYLETKQTKAARRWGDGIINEYPKEPAAYEFQMDLLMAEEDYAACFKLTDKFIKRGLSSKKMSKMMSKIEYNFFFTCEFLDVGTYSGGRCPVLSGTKWGYVNTTGGRSVAAKYAKVGAFSGDELAPVIDGEGNAYYIDPAGNKKFVILDIENVNELGFMENGIYSLYNGKNWGFYDKEYNHLFGKYDAVSSMGNGVAAVNKNGKWSLVNKDGKDLIGKTYKYVAMDEKQIVYRNNRLFVNDGKGYRMIDSSGKTYGDKKYQAVHIFNDDTYAAVMIDGKWGFVDSKGKMVIEPQYEDARSFANGFAAVKVDGMWGFINLDGKMVIEPQFENAKDFNDHGCVFVVRQNTWELLRLYKFNH